MKFEELQRQLERYGEAAAFGDDGDVVFRMETSFRGAHKLERLAATVDNTPRATVVVTGNGSSDALIMVRIPPDAFETVPPYIEDEL
jgi:hypothetical protein